MTDKAAVTYVDERGNEYLALVTRVDPLGSDEDAKPTLSVAFVNLDGIEDMHGASLSRRSGVVHKSQVPEAPAPDTVEALEYEPQAYWQERTKL